MRGRACPVVALVAPDFDALPHLMDERRQQHLVAHLVQHALAGIPADGRLKDGERIGRIVGVQRHRCLLPRRCAPQSKNHIDDLGRVVAEDVDDLDRDLVATLRRVFVRRAGQFQRPVSCACGRTATRSRRCSRRSTADARRMRPAASGCHDADGFRPALEVEVDRPVVDPVASRILVSTSRLTTPFLSLTTLTTWPASTVTWRRRSSGCRPGRLRRPGGSRRRSP